MKTQLSIWRLLVLSFVCVILAGCLALLISDIAVHAEGDLSITDALFTATSAVCVTGLTVQDTGTAFSALSQCIILLLIQIGGLGILTFSNFLLLLQHNKLDVAQREVVEETYGALPYIAPVRLLKTVMLYTFLIEGCGAGILTLRFAGDYPLPKAIWFGVFHSVSAFCNAGFSLFANNLESYRDDLTVNMTIMTLIVLGGLGFIVSADIRSWFAPLSARPRSRLALHSRVVLKTTTLLVLGGAFFIFLLELTGPAIPGSWPRHGLESLFLSVTSRTAGFNTVQTGQLTNGTLLVVIMLMTIGGSPGSTAGGVKTTTMAVLYALVRSHIRNRSRTELLERSIPYDVVAKAVVTFFGFMLMILVGVMALQITEMYGKPHQEFRGDFIEYLFEVVSALGTVGLSTGITPKLSMLGKVTIIMCMFVGRLGPLMIANSLIGSRRRVGITYPEERIIVG